jgi:hypothetical protein
MEEKIEFISSLKGFTAVKKLKSDDNKTPVDVVQFLTSVQVTTDNKIRSLLEEIIDIKSFNEQTNHLMYLEIPNFFKELYNNKTKKIITNLFPNDFDKKFKDAFLEAYQVYLIEKYFLHNKKVIGYHQILFPALKKLKKAIKG